jgi:predicted esterase
VRDLPEFKQLVDESNQKCLEARKQIKSERVVLLPEDTTKEMPLLIALHGRNGNMESRLPPWDIARQRGWLVLSPQSSQALYPGDMAGYCWDDPAQGMEDILLHINEIKSTYRIDHQRVIIGGFSQGSGMAIYSALRGDMGAQGFIGVATWWEDVDQLVCEGKGVRGYFVVGEKDHTLNQTREIQKVLRASSIQFAEEVHPEMGHEFPSDFAPSFDKAIEFIF